ncbi:PTS sugar transporter subunit IIA [bacterium]|nr:PTS sugar transporter subunit IIA [bacterium]
MDTSFISLFSEEHVFFRLKGRDKNEVLKEMVDHLEKNALVSNHTMLLETLKKRETLGSTGFGKEVAIPHCRTLTVSDLVVLVGFSEDGVEWNAMDKKQVKLIFLIVAPPQERENIYLPVLGKICEMIRDNKIRKNLLKAADYQQLIQMIGEAS